MGDLIHPAELHYLIEHQVWARLHEDGTATVGITALGIQQSGEIYMARPKGVGVDGVWRRSCGRTSTITVWLSADGGKHIHVTTLARGEGDNDHPCRAQRGGRLVVVWRTGKEVQLHDIPW